MQKKQIEYIPSARELCYGIYEKSKKKMRIDAKNENFQLTETYRYRVNDSEIYL